MHHTLSVRVELQVRRVVRPRTGHRKLWKDFNLCLANSECSGYVALAVSSEHGTYKRELDTGCGKDRQANMIAFATEALTLLRDVLKGDAKL